MQLPENHPHINGRTCTTCKEFKSIDNFQLERDERASGGISVRSKCKPCNELRKYKGFIKRFYKIDYEKYEEILKKQNYSCAICESPTSQNIRTSGKLFIDHSHETGRVRGLLCSKCNHALGQFNDDIGLLKKAIKYLENDQELTTLDEH